MKTYKRGISLIVLVITIIVLAILATATIITLSNTNIMSEAGNAVNSANKKQVEEALQLAMASYILDVNGNDAPTTVEAVVSKLNEYMPDDLQIETSDSGDLSTSDTLIHGTAGEYSIIISANSEGTVKAESLSEHENVVLTSELQVGDYVNYIAPAVNYTVLGTDSGMYSFLHEYTDSDGNVVTVSAPAGVNSDTGNQTFTTYNGKWQVLSVSNGTVMLINESSLGRLSYYYSHNINTILNNICMQYADNDIVAASRTVNYQDFVDGVMSTISTSSKVRAPGYFYCLGVTDWLESSTGGLWYGRNSETGHLTDDELEMYGDYYRPAPAVFFWGNGNLGCSDLDGLSNCVRGVDGVRAVITLKSDLVFQSTGTTYDGTPIYNIIK